MKHLITAVAALTLGLAALASAHDHPASQTATVQIPSGPIGGAISINGLGPPAGVETMHATAHITFTSNGTTRADEMLISVRSLLVDGIKQWEFTGADLGFLPGAGTYTGTIGTDILNGKTAGGLPGFPSPLFIDIMAVNGGLNGSFSNSSIELEWNETLTRSGTEISVSNGGAQSLFLNFGPAYANRGYVILGSATGTTPGLFVVGQHMPLNYDAYLLLTATSPNSVLMPQSLGILSAAGTAQTQFQVPPGLPASIVGLTLNHAALVFDAGGGFGDAASIPVSLTFVP